MPEERHHPRSALGFFLALSLLALSLLTGCDGYLSTSARVVDGSGRPIPGVLVCLVGADDRLLEAEVTGDDGCVEISEVVSPFFDDGRIFAWAPGFEPEFHEIPAGVSGTKLLILRKQGQPVSTGHDPPVVPCESGGSRSEWPAWLESSETPPSVAPGRPLLRKCLEIPGASLWID